MAWAVVGASAATLVGGVVSSNASRHAANTQADAAKAAAAQNQQNIQPWLDAGKGALTTLQTGLQPGGQFNKPFTMADATNSPAEQEALRRSSEATQNSAAAKGGLIGSNVMDQLQVNAGNIAAGFEGQAFDQWNTQQNRQLGATQSLAGVGQSMAVNAGESAANATLAAGGAQAGNQIAQGGIIGNTIGQIGNILGQSDLFKPSVAPNMGANPTPTGGDPYGMSTNNSGMTPQQMESYVSDERLKTDVERVGQTDGGLPIYKYRLRGQQAKQMGVMAQDVERVNPRAVTRHPQHGFRMVDYGKES